MKTYTNNKGYKRVPLPKWIKSTAKSPASGINYGCRLGGEVKGEDDIIIPRSGGVIRKIEHNKKGIPAPSYLKESNWRG